MLATLFVVLSIALAALAVGATSGRKIDTSLDRSVRASPAPPADPLAGAAQPAAAGGFVAGRSGSRRLVAGARRSAQGRDQASSPRRRLRARGCGFAAPAADSPACRIDARTV